MAALTPGLVLLQPIDYGVQKLYHLRICSNAQDARMSPPSKQYFAFHEFHTPQCVSLGQFGFSTKTNLSFYQDPKVPFPATDIFCTTRGIIVNETRITVDSIRNIRCGSRRQAPADVDSYTYTTKLQESMHRKSIT